MCPRVCAANLLGRGLGLGNERPWVQQAVKPLLTQLPHVELPSFPRAVAGSRGWRPGTLATYFRTRCPVVARVGGEGGWAHGVGMCCFVVQGVLVGGGIRNRC
jgi:hypothetical protein